MNEGQIEEKLITTLTDLKYAYRPDIRNEEALNKNFRKKFEAHNRVQLTDKEFARLREGITHSDVYESARSLRERHSFSRDDDTPLYYELVNLKDWCKNDFELINQLRINTKSSHHRYDVILLMNGLPIVQIELKTLQITPRRAMEQIVDYKNDPGNGYGGTLMCFLQLFIVSNLTDTWYFANNNPEHFRFDAHERFLPLYQFADRENEKITHLEIFAERFLDKCTLGQMIGRYMVLVESEKKLLVMRPYQIYAVKAIVDSIHQNCGNGYVWHTTGSGKTLTSFKTSTLLKNNPDIEKCLFVVDRKDLDRQTREEFNRFQEGCVEENTNTEALVRRLLSRDYADKVIVTTIQKLGLALDAHNKRNYTKRLEPLRDKRVVFIFDECHRSQFGENHKAIKRAFPNAQLFGFTGTPIFEKNAAYQQIAGQKASYKITEDIFPHLLHAYTITHAIEDRNVLRFHVHYYHQEGNHLQHSGEKVDRSGIVDAILEHHDAATAGRKFNAILATASINEAIDYFDLFTHKQTERSMEDPDFRPLNVACVFSPPARGNGDMRQMQEDLLQEKKDNAVEPDKKEQALASIIANYNSRYGTKHSVGEFDLYYQDLQMRMKHQQYSDGDLPHEKKIDLLIVVDMLLTGFDSKFLNTLYVDKNLKYHGLIQAFSRTNRVLNDTKPYGTILDFRQQQAAVDEAITIFSGGHENEKAREIWLVDAAPKVKERLKAAVKKLHDFLHSQGLDNTAEDVLKLKGDAARSQFITLCKEMQRQKTQLDQYTDLSTEEKEDIDKIISPKQLQGFKGVYLEIAQRLKGQREQDGEDVPPEVQELDFEYVLFASDLIDYDYIMQLIAGYSGGTAGRQEMTREQIIGLIAADAKFVDEREDITAYIHTLKEGEGLSEQQIRDGYEDFRKSQQAKELAGIAATHGLDTDALQGFIDDMLQRMIFDDEKLSALLAPHTRGWKARTEKKLALMKDLKPLLHRRSAGREISGLDVYE